MPKAIDQVKEVDKVVEPISYTEWARQWREYHAMLLARKLVKKSRPKLMPALRFVPQPAAGRRRQEGSR